MGALKLNSDEMVPVNATELASERPNLADIYIRLSDSKYVLLYKKGTVLDENRLANYRVKKQVEQFWVEKQFLHQFTLRNISLAGAAMRSPRINSKNSARLVLRAAESLFSEMKHLGFDHQTLLRAQAINGLTIKLAGDKKSLRNLLVALNDLNNDVLKLSLATSAVSVMLGAKLGFSTSHSLLSLSLGALLRDVGLTQLPSSLTEKPFEELTLGDRSLYMSHPVVGQSLLEKVSGISMEVANIVYQHEELPDGTGYPRQVKKMAIHPMSEIVIVAGLFAGLTIRTKDNPSPLPILRAAERVATTDMPFNMKTLRALVQITNLFTN